MELPIRFFLMLYTSMRLFWGFFYSKVNSIYTGENYVKKITKDKC